MESANGVRHCHYGVNGEPPPINGVAELAIEVGGRGETVSYFAGYHLQHDSSMLFTAGVGGVAPIGSSQVAGYLDLTIGAALLSGSDWFVAIKWGAGLKFLIAGSWNTVHPYVKVGGIYDLVFTKGGQSMGVGLTLGLSF